MNQSIPGFDVFDAQLKQKILEVSSIKQIPKGTEILREEQYVKVLPIVLNGLVKVFSSFDDRELLLYYIKPNQSCIMSFSAFLNNRPSRVFAVTEEDSELLLVPADFIPKWIKEYTNFSQLFFEQYDLRYADLLDTINHVLFNKMDQRLFDFLKERCKLLKTDEIKISHQQIATELGTAREVISRVIKKLEQEAKLSQSAGVIKILQR